MVIFMPREMPKLLKRGPGDAAEEKVTLGTLGTIAEQLGPNRMPFEYLLYVGYFLSNGGRVAN